MVRKATFDDIPAIADLYREQFREMAKLMPDFIKGGDQSTEFIENIISGEECDILVYEDNGNVVGFILLQAKIRPDFDFMIQGKYCYIMDVIVTENSRSKGFGTALMNSAKDWAKEQNCNFINLDVLVNNPGAIKLYDKLGFIPKAQEMYCKLQKKVLLMAKAYLICGKICCGKSTYAEQLRILNNAVLLSTDEITLALFGQHCGDKHDEYVERTEKYLLNKSLELIQKDINVVLDWGFWTKAERESVKEFYKSRNIECELYYIDISDETWKARLKKRNSEVLAEETCAYYIDDNLAEKFASIFEVPSEDEIDFIYKG